MSRWAAVLPAALIVWACASPLRIGSASPPPATQIEPPAIAPLHPAETRAEPGSPPAHWIEASRVPQFRKCAACHRVERGAPNGIGPNLYDVFGRPAATRPGYRYSTALSQSGLVWDQASLDRWLAGPRNLVPGTKMVFSGLRDPEERKAVIAFLRLRSAARP